MNELQKSKERFEMLKVCIIIPTYNNSSTLSEVICSTQEYTKNIIVVNDGSKDNSADVLKNFKSIEVLNYPENVGKGWALRKGFELARKKGYRYAISIDSDGQHFAKDLPSFLDKLDSVGDAIIIGARNMTNSDVPGKSSFAHKFSNFWFKVETGINVPDTQSGYRLYPLDLLKNISFYTTKYEFEIEVLVRASWKGIKIESTEVSVFYPPKEERITHFRPFADFSRISVLNTILVIITFLYIKPRSFIKSLFNKEKWERIYTDHFLNNHESNLRKSTSVAFGIFMGIIPIWGFQLITAIFLAVLLRLNKTLVIIAANISITPMIPLIVYLSFKMGGFCLGSKATDIEFNRNISIESVNAHWQQYLFGSVVLAIVASIAIGLITLTILKIIRRKTGSIKEA